VRPSPRPWIAVGVGRCGVGRTLGDIIAEFAVVGLGATVVSEAVFAEMVGDCLAAISLGIALLQFAIAPMRSLGPRKGLIETGKSRRGDPDRVRGRPVCSWPRPGPEGELDGRLLRAHNVPLVEVDSSSMSGFTSSDSEKLCSLASPLKFWTTRRVSHAPRPLPY
jgi:hypothetical protein